MSDFKLDRTFFWAGKIEDQEQELAAYWSKKTPAERLRAAWHTTCRAYGIDPNNPPKLDRTAFSMRKRK